MDSLNHNVMYQPVFSEIAKKRKWLLIFFEWNLKADENGNGYIELGELREALKSVGIDIPGYQARALEDEFKKNDRNKDGKLSVDEFEKVV